MTDTPEAVRLADPIKPLADAPIVAWCIESTDSADWCWSATRDGVIDNAKFLDDGCAPGEPFAVIRQADHQAQMNALLRRIPELETARDVAVELAAQYAAERDQLRAELEKVRSILMAQPAAVAQGAGEVVAWLWKYIGRDPYAGSVHGAADGYIARSVKEMNPENPPYPDTWKPVHPLTYAYTQPAAGADVSDMVEIMALADSYRNATCQEATASAREWLRAAIAASGRKS